MCRSFEPGAEAADQRRRDAEAARPRPIATVGRQRRGRRFERASPAIEVQRHVHAVQRAAWRSTHGSARGLGAQRFARERGITAQRLCWWRDRLAATPAVRKFDRAPPLRAERARMLRTWTRAIPASDAAMTGDVLDVARCWRVGRGLAALGPMAPCCQSSRCRSPRSRKRSTPSTRAERQSVRRSRRRAAVANELAVGQAPMAAHRRVG